MPELPPFKLGKRLVDVYERLASCFEVIMQIAQTSGLQVVEFVPDMKLAIVPSDVYDIALLIVSEVRYFATLMGLNQHHAHVQKRQRKLPSHVYQSAGLLHEQLREVQRLVQLDPNWYTMEP